VRKAIAAKGLTTVPNPHIEAEAEVSEDKALENLVNDPSLSSATRSELSRRAALKSLDNVVKLGPQNPGRK
jgi:hypothetical protein